MIDPGNPDYSNTPVSPQRPSFGYRPVDPATEPLVSIVTPFFNTREVMHEAAQSIFQQSLQRWEWLIVNDASTDRLALEILDQYRASDPRVRVIDHKENQGPGAARNTGYRHARAPYVFQMDDDDLLEPTVIEKMVWFLESYPEIALVNGWSVAFGAEEYLWPTGFDRGDDLLRENLAVGRALVRKSAHARAGGFDESIRGGMEDWDFWLRIADSGQWGATIPEYCDWYRRRPDHSDRWCNWDHSTAQAAFCEQLKRKHPRLYRAGIPKIGRRFPMPCESLRAELPFTNPLQKPKPRLLLIAPWLTMGGADKFNLDLIRQLTQHGWEVSVVTTTAGDHGWLPRFARYTPDIFVLHNFLAPPDHPVFLRYLIGSRRPDAVLLSNSEAGYWLLPYLRTSCPQPAYVDFCHSETVNWKNGGFPRYGVGIQDLLELNIVASEYLKGWMVARGADPERIEVVHINVDANHWAPCRQTRARVRAEYDLKADQPLILFAGRLHSDKQPRVLGQVLRRLAQRGLDFRAVIAGDGPDRAWLEEYIMENGLRERIALPGNVPNERIRELLSASDIFFLPSLWEGIALTIYEAMSCGVAVVGADVGGQSELVTPDCGVLVPKSDEAGEVAAYTDRLAELIADPARRRELGRRARERISRSFTLESMGRRFIELLEKARAWKSRAPRRMLSRRFALECATLAVELKRINALADELWQGREQLQRTLAEQLAQNERLLEARQCFLKTIEQQDGTIAELEQAKRYFQKRISAQADTIASLEEARAYFQKAIGEQSDTIAGLEEAKEYFQRTIRYLKSDRQTLQDVVEEQSSRIQKLQAQAEELNRELASETAKLAEMAAFVERLRGQWWWRWGKGVARVVGTGKRLKVPDG